MWIEPASSNVIFRSRRRAASAPATEDLSRSRSRCDDHLAANTARNIADHAHQDTEAIAATSRKNDRDFMYEVSSKMANLAVNANLPPVPLRSRESTPHLRGRPSVAHDRPISGYIRRDINALTPEDNSDIIAYLERVPSSTSVVDQSPRRLTHGSGHHYYQAVVVPRRAASLSPITYASSSRPSVPRWYPVSTVYGPARGHAGTTTPLRGRSPLPSNPVGLASRPPSAERLNGLTDSVVGVARTSLYGDIVIGIPYKKQYIFNDQRELDELDNILHSSALNQASNPTLFANNRGTLITKQSDGGLNRPYSRASYAGPTSGRAIYGIRPLYNRSVPHSSVHLSPLSTPADIDDMISIKSYPGTSARSTRRPLSNLHKVYDLEDDIDALNYNDESGVGSELSSLKRDAKSILNRYCAPPTTTRAPQPVRTAHDLDHKYGQILSSMQAKNRISPRGDSSTLSLPPYPAPPRKPEMSDTRRKLRELLCRSRNDPHYFDS